MDAWVGRRERWRKGNINGAIEIRKFQLQRALLSNIYQTPTMEIQKGIGVVVHNLFGKKQQIQKYL